MIVKSQNIKPGMLIYLPEINEIFLVESIEILSIDLGKLCVFYFFGKEENVVAAIVEALIPVVGFARN